MGVRRGEFGHDCVAKNGFRSRIALLLIGPPVVFFPLPLLPPPETTSSSSSSARGSFSSSSTVIGRDATEDMDEIEVTESVRFAARYRIGVEGVELVPCRCLK